MLNIHYVVYLHNEISIVKYNDINHSHENKNKQIGSNEKGLGDIQNVQRLQLPYKEIQQDDQVIRRLFERSMGAN